MLSVPANHEKHSDTIHVWQGCCNTLFLLIMIFACQQQYHLFTCPVFVDLRPNVLGFSFCIIITLIIKTSKI